MRDFSSPVTGRDGLVEAVAGISGGTVGLMATAAGATVKGLKKSSEDVVGLSTGAVAMAKRRMLRSLQSRIGRKLAEVNLPGYSN
eukprot:4565256-Prymnesium_polylepis.2